jgi:hypothetical protein
MKSFLISPHPPAPSPSPPAAEEREDKILEEFSFPSPVRSGVRGEVT